MPVCVRYDARVSTASRLRIMSHMVAELWRIRKDYQRLEKLQARPCEQAPRAAV